jgi:DNA-directed RNA polymerase specialized sigma24 family protein
MRYFLDETENEMSQNLNRPRTTVKWWLHSARKRLKHILHPLVRSEEEKLEAEHE